MAAQTAITNSFSYNKRLQPLTVSASAPGQTVFSIGYDFPRGNGMTGSDNGKVFGITNYRDTTRSQSFAYDALNRLTSGWSSANTGAYSWGENYSIDAWGNLQISPMGGKARGGNFTLSGNAQNRPTGLAYDAAGNLMSYLSATYTYDQENRLSSTAGMSYTYDGNGERVLKSNTSNGAAVKRYWSMGGNTLAEGDGSGNLTAEYVYFGGKRVARIDLPANTVHYYLSDHLGSTSVVVGAAGTVEEESDFYPFGTEVTVTGPGVNELKFTGKRRDTESQLDYFGARYFDNPFGRFMTPDPLMLQKQKLVDPQQWQMYQYARNNPLRYTDPTGKYVCADGKKCDSDNDKKFEASRQRDLKSSDASVRDAAASYGAPTVANDVTVKFDPKASEAGSVVQDKDAKGNPLKSATVTFRTASEDISGQVTVAHEGSHLEDFKSVMAGGAPMTNYQTEMKALMTGAAVLADTWTSVNNMTFNTQYGAFVFLAPMSRQDVEINRQSAKDFLKTPDYNLTFENQGGFPYVRP